MIRDARCRIQVNPWDTALADPATVVLARQWSTRNYAPCSRDCAADRAGLHWTYLSDLERGRQSPTLDVVNRLARALGVTLATFFAPLDVSFRLRFRRPRSDTQ